MNPQHSPLGRLALAILFTWTAGSLPAADAPRTGAVIRLQKVSKESRAVFEVAGLDSAAVARLARVKWERPQWNALFAIYVEGRGSAKVNKPLAMLGDHEIKGHLLRFEPRFPLRPGLGYRAVFDPTRLPGASARAGKRVVGCFVLPRPKPAAVAVVRQVYPSTNKLPENQLKFYIHFSAPMSRGDSYSHIKLLNSSGKAVDLPFLELDQEMWDPAGKRFTLFFDPGRIKRGLKPREEVGPSLEHGKSYTVVIDRNWLDAEGNPLKQTYRKAFRVGPPEDRRVDATTWKIQAPDAGTVKPLTVKFPRSMDHALLQRTLWVTDARGRKQQGTVAVSAAETCWQFTPKRPWTAGAYKLIADTTLEDLAGNSIARPFEVDVFRPVRHQIKTKTVERQFQVRARSSPK